MGGVIPFGILSGVYEKKRIILKIKNKLKF